MSCHDLRVFEIVDGGSKKEKSGKRRIELSRLSAVGDGELDLGDGTTRIEVLGASLGAHHDGVATVQLPCIIQRFDAFFGHAITAIRDPSVSLHKNGRAKVLVTIPPVTGARCGAASTENAFVHTIEQLAVLLGLEVFSRSRRRGLGLQPRLDRLVLLIETVHVRNKVLDNFHVRKRIDRDGSITSIDATETGKGVCAIDVHCTTSTDTFSARTTKGEGRVLLILDLEKGIQHHGTTFLHVDMEGLHLGLFIGVRVVTVDLEFLERRLRSAAHQASAAECISGDET